MNLRGSTVQYSVSLFILFVYNSRLFVSRFVRATPSLFWRCCGETVVDMKLKLHDIVKNMGTTMYEKIIAIGLTFLLCAGIAACSPNNDTQESITSTQNQSEQIPTNNQLMDEVESVLYENNDIGFSMEIPTSWEGKYSIAEVSTIVEDELIYQGLSFFHTATMDELGEGRLFSIGRSTGEDFTEDEPPVMSGQTIILAQTGGYTYHISFPSDVQYNEDPKSESAAEYKEMISQVDLLVNTFKLIADKLNIK